MTPCACGSPATWLVKVYDDTRLARFRWEYVCESCYRAMLPWDRLEERRVRGEG